LADDLLIHPPTESTGRGAPNRRLAARLGRSEPAVAQVLIAPAQLLLLFVIAFPALVAIYVSFTGWSPISGSVWYQAWKYWLWFGNYWEALSGGAFWSAVWRTAVITVIAVVTEFLLGFGMALLFLKQFRGRSLVTVVFLLPMMVVPAVSGFIFYMLLQTDGPVNGALTYLLHNVLHVTGTIQIGWLTNPSIALFSVTMVDIWQWTPLMFLILLSGLVALPEDQMNAARILGADYFQQLRYIVLPMMKPIILIAVIIRAIETLKLFDSAWLLTQGGPGSATTTVSVFLYRETFISTRWGYGSAVAILVLIMVSVIGIRAIRPIEAASRETIEELEIAEPKDPEVPLERAIEAEARAR
jgi:multiple sugar transport system permease protein